MRPPPGHRLCPAHLPHHALLPLPGGQSCSGSEIFVTNRHLLSCGQCDLAGDLKT